MQIEKPAGHMDHLLRQTRMHHMQLSSMADTKANMLLTMSSIVITLSVPHVTDPALRPVLVVLIAFCLVTILLASYSAMPKMPLSPKKLPRPDVQSPGFNPLFFGDFTRLDYPEYEQTMEKIMNDPNRAYEVQVREVYTLGVYLALQKYRYLRLAYTAFVTGLVVSGLISIATVLVSPS